MSSLKWSVTNDMHVTIDPRPVQPVNHCFTTCTGRTSRVKPFTGRICSTVLDKDGYRKSYLTISINKALIKLNANSSQNFCKTLLVNYVSVPGAFSGSISFKASTHSFSHRRLSQLVDSLPTRSVSFSS